MDQLVMTTNTTVISVTNTNSFFSNVTEKEDTRYRYLYMASVLFAGAIFIITVNILIIAAPIVFPPLRKKTYLFVSSLAVADVLTGLMHAGIAAMVIVRDFPPPGSTFTSKDGYCRIILFLYPFPQSASIFNLLLLALDR